jgi:hypothetical protein
MAIRSSIKVEDFSPLFVEIGIKIFAYLFYFLPWRVSSPESPFK